MIIRTSEISSQSFSLKWIIESNMHFKQVFKAYCAYIVLVSIRFVILRSDFRFRTVSRRSWSFHNSYTACWNDKWKFPTIWKWEDTKAFAVLYTRGVLTHPPGAHLNIRELKATTMATAMKTLNNEVALPKTLSRLFQLVQFVKCWQMFLELNSWRLYRSSEKEEESRCLVSMSSTKREIRHFHVVVVQWRQRNVQKGTCRVVVLPI